MLCCCLSQQPPAPGTFCIAAASPGQLGWPPAAQPVLSPWKPNKHVHPSPKPPAHPSPRSDKQWQVLSHLPAAIRQHTGVAEGSRGAGWGRGKGLPAGPSKPHANTIANAEGGGEHPLGRGTRQTSACPSLLSRTPGNGDRHHAGKSQPSSVALAGSRELFLNLLIRATCKQERKRPSLCGGEMALWSNVGRLADWHLILGCATDPPV